MTRMLQTGGMLGAMALLAATIPVVPVSADSMTCNVSAYKAAAGLTAACDAQAVTVTWAGQGSDELRMKMVITGGTPTIAAIELKKAGGAWATVAADLTPEYRVASGWRRLDQEAYPELKEEFGSVSQALLDKYKWDAFWDAPLRLPGGEVAHGGATPPLDGIPGTNQPGLPRNPDEVRRAAASIDRVANNLNNSPSIIAPRPQRPTVELRQ